jgi:hypothetical protein
VTRMERLFQLFGSGSEVARVAGVTRSAVSRWRDGTYEPRPEFQTLILKEAKRRNLDLEEIADLVGVERCPCCNMPLDREIRRMLK